MLESMKWWLVGLMLWAQEAPFTLECHAKGEGGCYVEKRKEDNKTIMELRKISRS